MEKDRLKEKYEKHEGTGRNHREPPEFPSPCALDAKDPTTGRFPNYREGGMNEAEVSEVLRDVASAGARIWREGDALKLQFSGDTDPNLVRRLKQHKADVLAALGQQARAAGLLRGNAQVAAETREVCIESPWGRVWVGPVRTGKDRLEVTWQELHDDPEGVLAHCRLIWDAVRIFDGRLLAGKEA